MRVMYGNRKDLRKLAQEGLKRQGYTIKSLGGAEARLQVTKNGAAIYTLVRTSSDRWLGWMRDGSGEFRGMKDADLIVAAVLDNQENPTRAEIYALHPEDVRQAFAENLAAREAAGLKKTAPVFVCMDGDDRRPAGAGSNLKAKALWRVDLPFDAVEAADPRPDPNPPNDGRQETREGFAARVRQEFADLIGVPVEKVSVDFRVSL